MNNKTDGFNMEQATPQDTKEVLALLVNTAKWFQSKGSSQWGDLLKGVDSHRTDERIQAGDVFVCRENGGISGMVMLLKKPSEWDKTLWQQQPSASDAIYLHRIAIHRNYANKGLGKKILNWACESTQFEGKNRMRLDCVAHNEFLNSYYKEENFTYKGEFDGYSLYERLI